jgi:hypothetical protein
MRNKTKFLLVSASISSMGLVSKSLAQTVSYTTTGSTYTQNFDSLGGSTQTNGTTNSWTNGSTLNGWYAYLQTTNTPTPSVITVIDGTSAESDKITDLGVNSNSTASNYANPGSPTGTNRALGSQINSTNANPIYYAVALTNGTGTTLTSFSLSYVAELWRTTSTSGAGPDPSYTLQYQIFAPGSEATDISASGWNNTSLNSSLSNGTTTTAAYVDGTNSANQDAVSGTVSGIDWANGQELWIRWTDNYQDSGGHPTNQMIGIDNVNITGMVPEPAASALLLVGLAAGSQRRRRKLGQ